MKAAQNFTREQFAIAARDLVHSGETRDQSDLRCAVLSGWTWAEHPHYTHLGYMTRFREIHSASAPLALEGHLDNDYPELEEIPPIADDAEADPTYLPRLNMHQFVVWSATYQVPAFYFTVQDPSGTPVSLEKIRDSALFRKAAAMTSFDPATLALFGQSSATDGPVEGSPSTAFPMVAQGDHPVLGTPCWVLHPCETSIAVQEVLAELIGDSWTGSESNYLMWLETWFMVLSGVVDLRL